MESAFYAYLEIKPPEPSSSFELDALHKFLDAQQELQQEDAHNYKNKNDSPFLSLFLAFVNSYSNWSSSDIHKTKTNFIVIICSKENGTTSEALIATCKKIAEFLRWELMEEIENGYHLIWSPQNT